MSRGDEEGDDLGILVGDKKKRTIEDWLMRSTPQFWKNVDHHLNQIPLQFSAWTEKIWQMRFIWANSELQCDPTTITDTTPPEGEPSVVVNWALPLSPEAHEAFATRVSLDYFRATAIVSNPEKKKQCRKSQARPPPHNV